MPKSIYQKRKLLALLDILQRAVTLWCREWMAGAIIDRFGIDMNFISDGDGFRICEPQAVAEQYRAYLASITAMCEGCDL